VEAINSQSPFISSTLKPNLSKSSTDNNSILSETSRVSSASTATSNSSIICPSKRESPSTDSIVLMATIRLARPLISAVPSCY